MSWGSKHPLVLKSLQATPDGLKAEPLDKAARARSMADSTQLMRETAGFTRRATTNPSLRALLSARIKDLDKRVAHWEAVAEEAEKEAAQAAAQGGEQ
ncbi:hypothetical protein [Xanthomonas arboricola]|uniref:hypothetical protein n=1 Tax=Xanthomonas arboricola TaxID=56448 RepID=UPI000F8CC615|nr:hypothetical protein [Xanthomonas arboricola]